MLCDQYFDWLSAYFDFSDQTNFLMAITSVFVLSQIVLLACVLVVSDQRSWVLINTLLLMVIGGCVLIAPVAWKFGEDMVKWRQGDLYILSAGILNWQLCWIWAVLFLPLQQLARRLSFVVLGVLTLVALSEISKLNLHQYLQPPKVSANSVR